MNRCFSLSFLLLCALPALPACKSAVDGGGAQAATPSSSDSGTTEEVPASDPAGLTLRRLSQIPTSIDAEGPDAWGWRDGNGENVFVVTYREEAGEEEQDEGSTRSRSMVVTHDVVGADGAVVRKRTVRDFVTSCPFDLHLQLEQDSPKVTDLDGDGLAEVTFGYQLTCTSDVSPRTRKLLLLEDGEKYILRGHTGLPAGWGSEEEVPSEFTLDPSVENGPSVFRAHLTQLWGRGAVEWR